MSDGAPSPGFATKTLAEIYLNQGHTAQALAIYQELSKKAPDDTTLARRVLVLTRRLQEERARDALVRRLELLKRLLRRVQRRKQRA